MGTIAAFWSQLLYVISNIRIFDLIDIAIMAFIVYKAIEFFKDTRAGQLFKGIAVVFAAYLIANWFELATVKWLILRLTDSLIVIAVIIFHPEIRRLLEKMGHSRITAIGRNQMTDIEYQEQLGQLNEICKAVNNMQEKKIGALIVLERRTPLGEIIDSGTPIDAAVSTELIQNVFFPKSPLHDGGMVIRGDRIASAGCILPLTSNNELSSQLGTRHRAAIGMSETSDAIVVVVSEETGIVSLAVNGIITRGYNSVTLKEALIEQLYTVDENEKKPFFVSLFDKFFKKNKEEANNEEVSEEE